MNRIEKLLLIICIPLTALFILFLTVPIWSDSKRVCEYWEKQDTDMVCIKETTLYCLKLECDE